MELSNAKFYMEDFQSVVFARLGVNLSGDNFYRKI